MPGDILPLASVSAYVECVVCTGGVTEIVKEVVAGMLEVVATAHNSTADIGLTAGGPAGVKDRRSQVERFAGGKWTQQEQHYQIAVTRTRLGDV